jgi:hypothetical protein
LFVIGSTLSYERKEDSDEKAIKKYQEAKKLLKNVLCKELKVEEVTKEMIT